MAQLPNIPTADLNPHQKVELRTLQSPFLHATLRRESTDLAYLLGSNPVVILRDLKLANILLRPVADEGEGGAGATPATAAVLAAAAGRFPPPPGVKYIVALCDFGLSSSIINPALSRRSEWHAARGEGPPPRASRGERRVKLQDARARQPNHTHHSPCAARATRPSVVIAYSTSHGP